MDLTPGMKKLAPWFGVIQGGTWQGLSTEELWDRLRDAVAFDKLPLPEVSATDVSRLRGIAASQREAMNEFRRATAETTIAASMIAQDISSRPLTEQALTPRFMVRFEWQSTEGGELLTEWKTSVWTGVLPPTKDSLLEQIGRDAERLGDDYDREHVGIGDILILAV